MKEIYKEDLAVEIIEIKQNIRMLFVADFESKTQSFKSYNVCETTFVVKGAKMFSQTKLDLEFIFQKPCLH